MRESKDRAKEKLENEITSRMKTLMIGALATIENRFGEIWGFKKNRRLTEDEEYFLAQYADARKEILDRGNNEIKRIKHTLEAYDVDYVGYTLELRLPVVRKL